MKLNKLSLAIVVGLSFGMVACGGDTEAKNHINDAKNTIDDAKDTVDDIKDTVDDAKDKVDDVKDKVDDVKDKVDDVKDTVNDKVDDVKDTVNDKVDDVKDKIDDAKDTDDGNNATELTFSSIDTSHDFTSGKHIRMAVRTDYRIKSNKVIETESVIKGDGKISYDDDDSAIYLAPHFHSVIVDIDRLWNQKIGPSMVVDSVADRKFHYSMKSETNGKKIDMHLQQATIDISGVTTDDKNKYKTALSKFNLMNSRFPDGSLCYVYSKEKPSMSHFGFFDDDTSDDTTLEAWVASTKAKHKDSLAEHYVNVGENNEYKAVYVETVDGKEKWGSYPAAVSYKGTVYKADYELDVGYSGNVDPTKGLVYCDGLNEVAADYLEDEIKAYGKL